MAEQEIRKSLQKWFTLALILGSLITGIANFFVSKIIFANGLIETVAKTEKRTERLESQMEIIADATESLQLNQKTIFQMHKIELSEVPNLLRRKNNHEQDR